MARSSSDQSMLARLVTLAATAGAAWAVQRLVAAVWKAASGHKPPKEDDDARLGELVSAAAITGALVALSRVLAVRGTTRLADRVNERRAADSAR